MGAEDRRKAALRRADQELESTTAARQRRLHRYFQPAGDSEQIQVAKAHEELAELCLRGFVKVILATNFDDLTDTALVAKGVKFQVVTPRTVLGMIPLVQAPLTVIKLHGDFRPIDIRNTPDELERYPCPLTNKLKEILRYFGLVVVGWSSDWDVVLRAAIEAARRALILITGLGRVR